MNTIHKNDAAASSMLVCTGRPGACPSVDARDVAGAIGMAMAEPRGSQTSLHSSRSAKQLRGVASIFDIGGGLHGLAEGDGHR